MRCGGCTEKEPCRDYAFDRFMADWGPASAYAQPDKAELGKTRSCGSGVIVTTKVGDREDKLWVQRGESADGLLPVADLSGFGPVTCES